MRKLFFDNFIVLLLFKYTLLEKEKRQFEVKLDKLDKLSRALQQERSELQSTIKNLSKPETTPTNGHDVSKTDSVLTTTTTTDIDESPNLYDSELGRIAKTVD